MSVPHLTVAVVCKKEQRILMVNEIDNGINCWNQPAGHVEPGESLETAAIREALEETGYNVKLLGIQGIYQGCHQLTGTHYVRVCFVADVISKSDHPLDADILRADWLPLDALLRGDYRLRSEITRTTLEDLVNAPIYPLTMINSVGPGALA